MLSILALPILVLPGTSRADTLDDAARQLARKVAALPVARVYDAAGAGARMIAERVAVNAREAGIAMQVNGGGPATAADVRLVRLRLPAADAHAALETLFAALGEESALPVGAASPEQLYAAERALVESHRVAPLVHLPEICGLGRRVKNRMPRRRGARRLDDLWLDTFAPAAAGGDKP